MEKGRLEQGTAGVFRSYLHAGGGIIVRHTASAWPTAADVAKPQAGGIQHDYSPRESLTVLIGRHLAAQPVVAQLEPCSGWAAHWQHRVLLVTFASNHCSFVFRLLNAPYSTSSVCPGKSNGELRAHCGRHVLHCKKEASPLSGV